MQQIFGLRQLYLEGSWLTHVRCLRSDFCIDIVGMYQWAWNTQHVSLTEQSRHHVWTSAGRLLSQFSRRNLLLLVPRQSLVGKDVLQANNHAQTDAEEFMELISAHDLCILHTWKSSRKSVAGTYSGPDVCAQIDFLATKRTAADLQSRQAVPLDLELVPWRHGAKHKQIRGSVPLNCDRKKGCNGPPQRKQYDKQALEIALAAGGKISRSFQVRAGQVLCTLPEHAEQTEHD